MTQAQSEHWSVVVLGGGDPNDTFAAAHGASVKPLIPIHGMPMAWYVLNSLKQSGRIQRLVYVGPTTKELDPFITYRVTDKGSLLGNLEAGISRLTQEGLRNGEKVLVVTADIPMVTPEQLQDLLDSAPKHAGLVYPVVRRPDCEAAFSGVKRTYAALQEGTFTGGNIFLLDPSLVSQFMPKLKDALSARKSPLRLAKIIGLDTLFLLLTKRLSIKTLEKKISHLLGIESCALITPHAAIGTDVDKESDLSLAIEHLKKA